MVIRVFEPQTVAGDAAVRLDGTWKTLRNFSGSALALPPSAGDFSPCCLLEMHGGLRLLVLTRGAEVAIWQMNEEFWAVALLQDLLRQRPAPFIHSLTASLLPFLIEMFSNPSGADESVRTALVSMGQGWFKALLEAIPFEQAITSLTEEEFRKQPQPEIALGEVLSHQTCLDPWVRGQRLPDLLAGTPPTLPSLIADAPPALAWPMPNREDMRFVTIALCRESGVSGSYLRFGVANPWHTSPDDANANGAILLPRSWRLVLPMAGSAPTALEVFVSLRFLANFLVFTSTEARAALARPPAGQAMLLREPSNVRHLGHAFWYEHNALEQAARSMSHVVVATRQSGAEIFGDIEALYPELTDRVVRVDDSATAYRNSWAAGLLLFATEGKRALAATRARISAQIERFGSRSGANAVARMLAGGVGPHRPIIALGLRLTNRCPTDAIGFHERLCRALADSFGPLTVILDGINGFDEPGSHPPHLLFSNRETVTVQHGEISSALADEQHHALELEERLRDTPVRILSCVGMPLLANLFWLSRCQFFIAPQGAGLVKVRWALDTPGLIIQSAVNHKYYRWKNIYEDINFMDKARSKLYFTTEEEVIDVIHTDDRSIFHSIIPWPDLFSFKNEAETIDRIISIARPYINMTR